MSTDLAHSDRPRLATTTEAGEGAEADDKIESVAEEKVTLDDGDAARGSDIDVEKGLAGTLPMAAEPTTNPDSVDTTPASALAEKPYSSFSETQKWLIVALSAVGAICSPISSNIYAPVIPTLAGAFGVSVEKINLTVTIYMIFQAITPAFWGSAADVYGRRPVYIATIAIFTLACLGTALCPADSYWLLLVLRIVQSSGASATIAVGAGITADVAMPHERGNYIGLFNATSTFGPAIGPLLGGVLAYALGWRAVFWFLVILGGVILLPVVLFLPETLRSLVGDGSRTAPLLNRTPGACIRRQRAMRRGEAVPAPGKPLGKYAPFTSFRLLLEPDLLLILIWSSLYYSLYYAVLMIFSTLLDTKYAFSPLVIGVCYIPNGAGVAVGGIATGKVMDWQYAREKARVGVDHRDAVRGSEFRLERVRLGILVPHAAVLLASAVVLGWTMKYKIHIAVPHVANFVFGLGTGFLTTTTIFALDLVPGKGSAVTASFNLTRCLLGAAAVAIVQPINRAIGSGWLFVVLCGICLAATPLPLVVVKYGPRWRAKRDARRRAEVALYG